MSGTESQNENSVERTEALNPGRLQEIYLSRLTSGLNYQRTVDEKAVRKLAENWNPRYLDPVTVSYRDGKYNVIDGQHRIAAMRRMKESGKLKFDADVKVLCIVHTGLTYQEEAELFYRLDQFGFKRMIGILRRLDIIIIMDMTKAR